MADDVISRSSKLADLATDLAVKLERACDPDKMVRFNFWAASPRWAPCVNIIDWPMAY